MQLSSVAVTPGLPYIKSIIQMKCTQERVKTIIAELLTAYTATCLKAHDLTEGHNLNLSDLMGHHE